MKSLIGDLLLQRLAVARGVSSAAPTNRLLYECLRGAILDGTLPAAARLPPSRDLARELAVSRNTVVFAYDQLLAEGYVRSRVGSGTFVAEVFPDTYTTVAPKPPARAADPTAAPPPPTPPLSQRALGLLGRISASTVQWGAFMPGVPDVTAFPHRRFAQILAQHARGGAPSLRSYATAGGHPALQRSLANYLRQARSVTCEAGQILITEGIHQAIDLVTRLLADPGDAAWVEDPGYWGTRSILGVNGVQARALPVDAEGLQLPEATPEDARLRLAFVTPSHQYPLGSVMSLTRRLALLEAARRRRLWVVEDDYDSEFRFAGQPIPSLQGLVDDAPVIYVGTFSKTLYPGLRTAYMVLPPSLADTFRSAQMELYRGGHLLEQAALADFMDSGQYAAHIRRMRILYGARRARLIALVEERLGPGWIHPFDSNAGLHLVLSLPAGVSDVEITAEAGRAGVLVRPLSRYYAASDAPAGLLLGFASVPEAAMAKPMDILASCIERAVQRMRPN
ncbi:MocR-like pyridoxine biosynthesis transcription factor PdxR [Hydrogenophaga sp. BPS33]|uniref:MocR-like pyridoxine biosynthesis transcription factor PdxR n=1 Tax=Hydrogenophaga sp. BPS33 TaxID=2651974 RepID=UPI0013201788|nr:PLP-dependent aminotransferase family protein [Hydrogenophaga sp. BPS33]QHE84076.1 PLP-dependent aminotransferase family protein [Hydrogenophaga sp. BPS33]